MLSSIRDCGLFSTLIPVLKKYNGFLMVATAVWSLVPYHSFDSGSRSRKYSVDVLQTLESVYTSQAHCVGYQKVLV